MTADTSLPAKDAPELFCPLPLRARSDNRLSARHFRLMAAIAGHDRLGHTGRGCYARPSTLCKEAKIHPTDFADLLRDLEQWGYAKITRTFGKRVRTIHLIYERNSRQLGASTNFVSPERNANIELGASTNLPVGELGAPEAPSVDTIEELDNNRCSETKIIDAVKQTHSTGVCFSDRDLAAYTSPLQRLTPRQNDCLQWGDVVTRVSRLAGISPEDTSGLLAAVSNDTYTAIAEPGLGDNQRLARFKEAVGALA